LRGGAFGATEFAGVAFGASALLSWDHYVTSREMPTFARSAAATYDGWSAALSVDASRAFAVGEVRVEPLAGVTLVRLSRQSFTERGAGALSLVAEGADLIKLASRIGASLSTTVRLDNMRLHPWLRAFWAHDFCDIDGPLTASFAGATAPGTFTVLAASRGRDVALVGLGARLEVAPLSSVMVAYDGELGRNAAHHSLTAGVKLQW
jgi:outer membrane autotransporter protein